MSGLNTMLADHLASAPHRSRPVVLTTVPYYLPGFKGGGKLLTVRNLVAGLRDQFDFKVLTADRDLGDTRPYSDIALDRWNRYADCEIYHASARRASTASICRSLKNADYDIIHLNSLWSRRFGLVPLMLRKAGLIPRKPMIIAPRGELGPGAVAIKSARKRALLAIARCLGWFADVTWQASCPQEAGDIQRLARAGGRIVIAPDLLSGAYRSWKVSQYRKQRGRLEIVFLSRICPKKNLHSAIEALRGLSGDIRFRIAGPIDDAAYWARCLKLIRTLNSNIRTDYLGPLSTVGVADCLAHHGLLFLPSANENFGFVILEALLAGCPVLLSDQTPWRDLERRGIGWDLALSKPTLIRAALRECIAMDTDVHKLMSERARQYATEFIASDDSAVRNAAMFHAALDGR